MSHNLSLTDDEFRTLALAIYLGEHMANIGTRPGKEPYPEITALLQRIYSQIDEDAGEDKAATIIDHYDEDTMYEELAHQLAERDIHERIDHADNPPASDIANRPKLERQRAESYHKEFDEHGLGHLVIDRERPIPCEDD